ncbi:PPOX class F420-dependent oxidoreductase [Actinomadura sp. NAK00032]|uniref:PPOX class F420-dependent oxidoreductase n=1 Tax=Actinomadura sp. NAK00032 TaxID=2742128 RepID=UPI001591A579|nr:PPOX class F420-dependent oxidoreductase [Actinomadura sp. NAK00032]QKW36719.1 PPOX class F420-dependent oxidoreductase [Actinomadura sp. NAK00032]
MRRWTPVYWALDRVRHSSARRVAVARASRFEGLRGHGTVLVVTFRGDGTAVPTPLSCVMQDGRLLASTAPDSGKVKRIRRDPRALVAPATVRGRPVGPAVEAAARILEGGEAERAEQALAGRFGPARRLYRRLIGVHPDETAYLEFSPGGRQCTRTILPRA